MNETKQNALKLIKTHMGDLFYQQYEPYYNGLSTDLVKVSIKELMSEYLGETQALKILSENNLV